MSKGGVLEKNDGKTCYGSGVEIFLVHRPRPVGFKSHLHLVCMII